MAVNTVQLVGDQSSLIIDGVNITAVDPVVFLSGSFRASPEERRVASVFMSLEIGTKTVEMRLEFSDPSFVQTTITGRPVYRNVPPAAKALS